MELRGFCDSKFWDFDLFWNTENPQLTSCFRHSILDLVPSAVLLLTYTCASFLQSLKLMSTYPRPAAKSHYTLLYIVKLILSSALLLCVAFEVFYFLYRDGTQEDSVPFIELVSCLVRLATMSLVLFLQVRQWQKGELSSNILFLFWSVNLLCGFFSFPVFDIISGSTISETDPVIFIVNSISFPLVLAEAVLSVFTDPAYSLVWEGRSDEYVMEHQPPLSRLLFSWMNRLLLYGYRHKLKVDDIDDLAPERKSVYICKQLTEAWRPSADESSDSMDGGKTKRSLLSALLKLMWPYLLAAAILEIIYDLVVMLPPLLMESIIGFTQDENIPRWHGWTYAIGLLVSSATCTILGQHNMNFTIFAAFIPKVGLAGAIYRKSLKLSNGSKQKYTIGELCNLVAVDTQEVFMFVFNCNLIWSIPLKVALNITLLWRYLNWTCLAGVSVMILIMPLTAYLARLTHRLQKEQMKKKDFRLRQMGDLLNGIKILKLFAWELPFMKRISDVRVEEIESIKRIAIINAIIAFFWTTTPFLVAVTSFVTFVLSDERNVLNPTIAFVSLTLFNQLGMIITAIPDVLNDFIQARVSLRRINKFLHSEELREKDIGKNVLKGECLTLKDCSFSWSSEEEPFLRDVSLSIPEGSLVAIVGQVGSGKSALLSAILGEMHKVSGEIRVKEGDIAYVAQQAWIQNATVEENIIFMKQMSPSKYQDVLRRCCLTEDLKILPAGDQTEIGEKGVNLSGGQKQRVSLARAVYHQSDMYLLDDPLSAVDSHVGSHIFKEVIGPKGALKKKTRILVTHDLSILPEMDLIVVMSAGRTAEIGPYQQLMDQKGQFSKFVEEHQKKAQEDEEEENTELQREDGLDICESPEAEDKVPDYHRSASELKEQMKKIGSRLSRTLSVQDPPPTPKKDVFIIEEKMETGRVKAIVFMTYFRYASFVLISFMVLSFIIHRVFEAGSNFWLSSWSSDPPPSDTYQRNVRIVVYGLLGIGQGLSILIASFLLAFASTRASRTLHSRVLISILRSPMLFFETTPVGRILNRFGKDINIVDTNLPYAMSKVLTSIVGITATVAVIAISNAIFIAIILTLAVFYYIIQVYYMETSRQVRRMQSTAISPLMSNFSESVQGSATIRAFRVQELFADKEDRLVDTNIRTLFCAMMLNRWLSIRLELLGSVLVFSVALLTVLGQDTLSAGLAGLTLTYALNITNILAVLVKFYVNLEIRMVSVERISEYCELLPEASWEPVEDVVSSEWPERGSVSFTDYKMRYNEDLNFVLNGIDVDIHPGEKVGIVGRTGAGKSSLALALFRLVEPAGGSITIDGIDIAQLGLHQLRSRITIIPQDPILFQGTIRINLDPAALYPDQKLWESLEHAHLKNFLISLDGGLDHLVSSGGDNLSVGQRQQLCLARALLKKTKVLVLDEATAAVDMETDSLIQNTIRREFDDCTVITIAHRLYTILDYDRIIVMDNGKIVEQGSPDDLLQTRDSYFFKLSKDAGLI